MDTKSTAILRTESFELENPEVYVETVCDDVSVIESPDGKCHVEISAKSENARAQVDLVDISVRGQKISIRPGKRSTGFRELFSGRNSELFIVVKLPATSQLKIKTVSADVEVDQTLKEIEIGTVSGDVVVRHNPHRTCVVKTVSGDIRTQTFSSCEYTLKTVSGDISVKVAPGLEVDVDGKSISGDLASEISLNSSSDSTSESTGTVTINTSTVSGDFILARN